MSRNELHHLVRNLRQYLEWQAVPLAAVVPAPADEKQAFAAAAAERQRAALEQTLEVPRAAPAPKKPAESAAEQPKAAALWKDDSFGQKPRKTFAPQGETTPRTETLAEVRKALGDCKLCGLCESRTNIVFGVGNPQARLMFVGEAPGFHEDKQGEPFVGKAGELLDKMVRAMTLSREEIYIANVLKCRPPNNRDPEPTEIVKCTPFLERQVAAIQPEVIVATGKFAANFLTGNTGSLSRIRGKWHEYQGVPVMPTFHPAYLLRNPADKGLAWDDLKKVMTRLEIEIPEKYR